MVIVPQSFVSPQGMPITIYNLGFYDYAGDFRITSNGYMPDKLILPIGPGHTIQ